MYIDKKVAVLIPSAGYGTRMGGQVRKQYLHLREKEILRWTLEHFYQIPYWDELFVIVPPEDVLSVQEKVNDWFFEQLRKIVVISGGATRQQSVFNGLNAIAKDADVVIVHDGVRPFLPIDETVRALDKLVKTPELQGLIAGVKTTDTLKRVNASRLIEATIDREKVWAVQTPQIFKHPSLLEAHLYAIEQNLLVTDDAALLEYMGNSVGIFESNRNNIKITEPYDLTLANMVLNQYMKDLEGER
ncbi:2-C-methyl-D-erythritol 4-phosphate cytidylyltransferase [Fusibacter bizertensis]